MLTLERLVLVAIGCVLPAVACSKRARRSTDGPSVNVSSEPGIEDAEATSAAVVSTSPAAGPTATDARPRQPGEQGPAAQEVEQPRSEANAVGCWERTFGSPPAPEALEPSLAQTIPDCADCPPLHAGPKASGLHPEVIRRLHAVAEKLPAPAIPEPVMWVNSGAREGPRSKSMHNQALAVDLVICGLNSPETAVHLRAAGFTCVIEYYDGDGSPCSVAHADLRGTEWAKGAYAPGGWKSKSCPDRAVSKGEDCQNQKKTDWSYSRR